MYQVRFRVYDPISGRWLSRDPAGFVDGANLYEYCRGSVNGAIDPTGLFLDFLKPVLQDFWYESTNFFQQPTRSTERFGEQAIELTLGIAEGVAAGIVLTFAALSGPVAAAAVVVLTVAALAVTAYSAYESWEYMSPEEQTNFVLRLVGNALGGRIGNGVAVGYARSDSAWNIWRFSRPSPNRRVYREIQPKPGKATPCVNPNCKYPGIPATRRMTGKQPPSKTEATVAHNPSVYARWWKYPLQGRKALGRWANDPRNIRGIEHRGCNARDGTGPLVKNPAENIPIVIPLEK